MKFKKTLLIALLSILLIPTFAFALNFEVGDEIFNTETINDDYYAAGGKIELDSIVNGDMIMAGGELRIDSKISQDLTLVGGEIRVKGEVADDARIGGGNVIVNATIKDDLIVGAGNFELGEDGFVGGDLIFGGGNVVINGMVNGNIKGGGGSVYINNVVTGDVNLIKADKVKMGPRGKVLGDFKYKSLKASETINTDTVQGSIDFTQIKNTITDKEVQSFGTALFAGFSIFRLLTLLFTGLFFIWIFRFYMTNAVNTGYKYSLKSFGVGFLTLIMGPVAALLSLITGIGLGLSFLIMLMWFLALAVGKLIAAYMIGMKIIKVKDSSGFVRAYISFVLGALLLVLISMVPLLGWIIKFILVMIGIGAVALHEMKLFNLLRKDKKV